MAQASTAENLLAVLDRFSKACGKGLAWLLVLLMLNTCLVVVLRYVFGIGSAALQELSTYLHATVFMLGMAYALRHGAHVRVDIFYRRFSTRTRAWVDAVGALVFLLPLCGLIFFSSLNFVANSWAMGESSSEPGGIPAVYLLKTLIPAMAVLLSLQAVAELLRNALILWRDTD